MIKNTNSNVQEIFKLAVEKHIKKNLRDAQILYTKILNIEPKHVNSLNNLGELFRQKGKIQKAKIFYEKAIEIDPNLASAYNNLGLIYLKNKNIFKAKSCYEKAIELDPQFANANYNLGNIYRQLGDYEKAINYYEKVIKVNENHSETYNNLGIIYEELGETQNAKNSYNKAIKINPNDKNALWNSHILASDIEEALFILYKLYKIDKKNIKVEIMISGLEAYKGNLNLYNEVLKSENLNHPYTRSIKWIFSLPNLPKIFFNRWSFFDSIITLTDNSRPFYEYGVWNGVSFKYLIKSFKKGFGFDTFTGIPETWHNEPKGNYTNFGVVPDIEGGEFIVGKFEDTLPKFFLKQRQLASLINFDADLYSSTICALNNSKEIIDKKTILIFDEFIMNDNWELDEYKALNEFSNNLGVSYEVIAVCLSTKQVALKLNKDI